MPNTSLPRATWPVPGAWWGAPDRTIAEGSSSAGFSRYRWLRIPVTLIPDLKQRRAAVEKIVGGPSSCRERCTEYAGCVHMSSLGASCPQSFGNSVHLSLSSLMLARVAGARVVVQSPPTKRRVRVPESSNSSVRNSGRAICGELLQWKLRDLDCNCSSPSSMTNMASHFVEALPGYNGSHAGFAPTMVKSNAVPLPHDSSGTCATLYPSPGSRPVIHFYAQEMAILSYRRSANAKALFGLGPHFAFGTLFREAFGFIEEGPGPRTAAEAHGRARGPASELRIGVHIRHFRPWHNGSEAVPQVERALRQIVANATTIAGGSRRCAILLATDRRLALELMQGVAARLECRLVQSARGAERRTYNTEHGVDTGAVALRDLQMLATAHLLLGTYGSTFTFLAQSLIAANYRGGPVPTVQYCCYWMGCTDRGCTQHGWPLITTPESSWFVSMDRGVQPPFRSGFLENGAMVHWPGRMEEALRRGT